MERVSKKTSEHVAMLAKLFLAVRGSSSMAKFLLGMFTEGEIEELSRRVEIVKMLKKGVPHHKIALTLGVGVATVTRGARELKLGRFKMI